MNLYTPERQPNESREQYAQRRKVAKKQVQALTLADAYRERTQPSQRQKLRDQQRTNGHGPKGTFADAIGWAAAAKRVAGRAA